MTTQRVLLACAVLGSASAFAAESVLPSAYPMSRYDAMLEKSPFALATPVAPPVVQKDSAFAGWFIGGIAEVEGKAIVTLKTKDQGSNVTLYGETPNDDGLQVVSVEWSGERGMTSVKVKKGAEVETLKFNQAELQTPTAQVLPQPRGGGGPQQRGGGAAPPVVGGARTPAANPVVGGQPVTQQQLPVVSQQPQIRSGGQVQASGQKMVIPRPASGPVIQQPANSPQQNPQGGGDADRRRIRVINPRQ